MLQKPGAPQPTGHHPHLFGVVSSTGLAPSDNTLYLLVTLTIAKKWLHLENPVCGVLAVGVKPEAKAPFVCLVWETCSGVRSHSCGCSGDYMGLRGLNTLLTTVIPGVHEVPSDGLFLP